MPRLAQICVPLIASLGFISPALAADLDGPVYRERDVVIERPAPVVRERIIERRYYEEVPEAYYAPRVYAPATYYYAPPIYRGYAYGYGPGWRHRHIFYRPWGHRYHRWHW